MYVASVIGTIRYKERSDTILPHTCEVCNHDTDMRLHLTFIIITGKNGGTEAVLLFCFSVLGRHGMWNKGHCKIVGLLCPHKCEGLMFHCPQWREILASTVQLTLVAIHSLWVLWLHRELPHTDLFLWTILQSDLQQQTSSTVCNIN